MSGNIWHSIFVQRGSSQTFRVADEDCYLVLDEAWQARGGLLNTTIRASYPGTAEGKALAEAEAARLQEEMRRGNY